MTTPTNYDVFTNTEAEYYWEQSFVMPLVEVYGSREGQFLKTETRTET